MRNAVLRSLRSLWISVKALVVFGFILGVLYPGAVWAVGRLTPGVADGSFIVDAHGEKIGSKLLGQAVTDPRLFYPRPSAAGADNAANTGDDGYDAMASGASNLAASSTELVEQINTRRTQIAARESVKPQQVPADAVTASGSGLDPHISVEYAQIQIPRVAKKTGLAEAQVRQLVAENTEQPLWGFLGQTTVNTTTLNIAIRHAIDAKH